MGLTPESKFVPLQPNNQNEYLRVSVADVDGPANLPKTTLARAIQINACLDPTIGTKRYVVLQHTSHVRLLHERLFASAKRR